jgi:long-chain acyl-CoA synthetase
MHPRETAERNPDRPAVVMAATGTVVTYAELAVRANRGARLFRSLGLSAGDGIAFCLENHPRYFELCWAAHNAGLYYTPISWRLKPDEIGYILRDCGARVFISSSAVAHVVGDLSEQVPGRCACLMIDGVAGHFESYEAATATAADTPVDEAGQGVPMVYSSGTTGRPKGIKPPLPVERVDELAPLPAKLRELYGFDEGVVYLSTAPLYHAAPLKFNLAVQACGGTSVVLEKFEPERALECIERHRVTHSQWVPTMFIRMLRLPDDTRNRYDLKSHRVAIHSAAPCPIEVKERMLEWWGPIIHEYYSGSESIGLCAITPQEWVRHKGSVGRPVRGVLHVVGDDGREVPPGTPGQVYFETATPLRYHNDPEKTARAHNDRGWATMGDVGHVDEEGYLYLTDRRDYVIISGGVNIYPQECEQLLETHPKVADVAIFGVPNQEFGEEVKAVVVAQDPAKAGPGLAQELIEYCRSRISSIKCPKSVDFVADLPREPTGKLMKKQLRQKYWDSARDPGRESA